MTNDNDIAHALYGGHSAATRSSSAASTSTPEQAAADGLYDGNAAVPPAGIVETALNGRQTELFTEAGLSQARFKQIRADFAGIQQRTGIPDGAVRLIADHYVTGLIADARPVEDPDAEAHALATQVKEMEVEALDGLVGTYGKDAERILERTRKWVRSQPALAKVLQQRGLGSHPKIVNALAAHVFSNGLGL